MATRQYIGARYVPVFFNGTGGSAEWVANTQYEALTIITRNGNSYTSRKPVPANIGAPENNPDYWVSTGIFNEQVEQYRQAVETLSDDLSDLSDTVDALPNEIATEKRAFFLQSDSLGSGIISTNNTGIGWCGYFKNTFSSVYNVYTTDNVPSSVGAGLTGFNSSNKHITNLQWCVENELRPAGVLNDITDVIVLSGTNDASEGTGLYDAVLEYIDYCRSVFKNKNLRIVIGCCACRAFDTRGVAKIYQQACRARGVEFAYDLLNIFASVNYNSDNTHYTQAGYTLTNPIIADYIINGHTTYNIDSVFTTDKGNLTIIYANNGALVLCNRLNWSVSNEYLSTIHITPTDTHVFSTFPWGEGVPMWEMLLSDKSPANLYKFPGESYFRGLGNSDANPIENGTIYIMDKPKFITIAQYNLFDS